MASCRPRCLRKACLPLLAVPVDRGADAARDIDRGKPLAAAGIVHQHGFLGFQRAHDHEQLPRGEVSLPGLPGLLVGEQGWFAKTGFGHDHYVRIAAEPRQRKDVPADPRLVHVGPAASTVPETS